MDEQTLLSVLNDLKNNLGITWDEEDKDLKPMIKRSESYLQDLTGTTLDFSKEEPQKELLLERCRYVYNHAADEFETNFAGALSRLIIKEAVKAKKETEVLIDGTI